MQNEETKTPVDLNQNKRKKMALGRGLDSLIPTMGSGLESNEDNGTKEYLQCDIDLLHPNRYQPRTKFSETELEELSLSIREQGIIQPLLVRKRDGYGYELIAGERRLRAAKMAGLTQVPIIIKDISDTDLLEMSIVENIQRENLNPLEEADAYNRLMNEFKMTQEDVAKRVGKSRPAVANFLRLRQLPDSIKGSMMDGTLSMGHARALLCADTPAQQNAAWRLVISKGLSVRETEALMNRLKAEKEAPEKPEPSSEDIYFSNLADDLSRHIGSRVNIKRQGKKGKVEIEYYSDQDLDRLINIFKQI